ncbi:MULTISPECIES: cyclase family protein [Halorussus]|uniref:cyclase family protein n=1 Tax=Halorussus TaxID=1070314 RepID=UPI000E210DED|nr:MULTISPECIES: cyclase family protein [Halorussus]NHN58933.1 cyclase family protein [Halorussus sp. JP-T4]
MTDDTDDPTCECDTDLDRRDVLRGTGALAAFAAAGVTPSAALAQSDRPEGDLEALLEDMPRNWGRWGEDDELGAFNFLGGEQALAGLAAVTREGATGAETFTLQLSMTGEVSKDPIFPTRTVARRTNTRDAQTYERGEHEPSAGGIKYSDDRFLNRLYPQGTTHVDAPGHAWYGDRIYNGFDADTTAATKRFDESLESCDGQQVEETRGLGKADVSGVADHGIVGRGVLLDVGRAKGGESNRLEPNACISLADLRETADKQGVELRERDVPLIRTGSAARARDDDPEHEWAPLEEPGLCYSEDLVNWVHEMEFPVLGGDTLSVEKNVQVIDGEEYLVPLHGAFHRNLGVPFNEVLWLEDLAESCASDGVYDFLFAGAPLNIERATGAPINPVVVKATTGEGAN